MSQQTLTEPTKRKVPHGGEMPSPRKTNTKVEEELLRKARIVAESRKVDLFDYLDALLRPSVERDYRHFVRKAAEEAE